MSKYSEEYRGRTIRVVRDDAYPVVRVDGGNAFLTVAQARRSVDHFADRSCAAHGRCSGDALPELREHGVYAGVTPELRCYCPGDCGCRPRWTGDVPRNVCGCRQHEFNARVTS